MALVGPTLSPRDLSSHCQEPHGVQSREPGAGHKHGDMAVGEPTMALPSSQQLPKPWPDKSEIWVRLGSFKPGSPECPHPSPELPFPVDLRTDNDGSSQPEVMRGQQRLEGLQQERSRQEGCG